VTISAVGIIRAFAPENWNDVSRTARGDAVTLSGTPRSLVIVVRRICDHPRQDVVEKSVVTDKHRYRCEARDQQDGDLLEYTRSMLTHSHVVETATAMPA
jgi:hypothetical protein